MVTIDFNGLIFSFVYDLLNFTIELLYGKCIKRSKSRTIVVIQVHNCTSVGKFVQKVSANYIEVKLEGVGRIKAFVHLKLFVQAHQQIYNHMGLNGNNRL